MMQRDPLFGVPKRIYRYAAEILAAAQAYGLEPLILAAIVDHESAGGESPSLDIRGPGGRGDGGHGHGLMQIDDRSHLKWLAQNDWKNPALNIMYGAQVLAESIKYCGDLEAGIAGYNCGQHRALQQLHKISPTATPERRRRTIEWHTYHRTYVTSIMRRVERWSRAAEHYYSKEHQNVDA